MLLSGLLHALIPEEPDHPMRLFTALDLPDPLRDDLARLQASVALPARWTDPEQFHVTLRFIGEASEKQTARYEQALADIETSPVECNPYGIDALPSRRSPRVLVLGLKRTTSILTLYDAVSDALQSEGLDPADRTYRPHVTIARLGDVDPESVHAEIRQQKDHSFSSFTADRFVLYESTLTPDGAVHTPQSVYSLSP